MIVNVQTLKDIAEIEFSDIVEDVKEIGGRVSTFHTFHHLIAGKQ